MFRFAAVAALAFAASCGVGQSEVTVSDDGTDTTDQEVRKNSPCMTVRCSAGYHCVARGQRATCEIDDPVVSCASVLCIPGTVCQETKSGPRCVTAPAQCQSDADCQLVDNYCDGCACDAIGVNEQPPACGGTIVQCFAQPCANKVAKCSNGTCQTADATAGVACGTATCPSGQVCCNASCGICTPPGYACIQIACQ
jgi:hypothetical protein